MSRGMEPMIQADPDGGLGKIRSVPASSGNDGGTEHPALSAERIELGRALSARAHEVGTMVDRQFAADLRGNAYVTARLGTELIGRWLATDEAASEADEATLAQQGEQAILEDAVLATVAKAYFAWRDTTIAVLKEEGDRLGVSEPLLVMATNVVRFSCDGSLVRLIRQFDDTRRSLQQLLHEEQDRLAHRALHDQLTGLPNRALLADRLRQAAASLERRGTGAVLLYLDLDNFKAINDRFGHSAGDCLLSAVATRLQLLARSGDTVARLGGDEFVVLAVDLDDPEAAARSLAERIHLAMREAVPVGERELHTSVSIGIAAVLADTDPEVCLAQADAAMYQAKRGGPARYEAYNPVIGEDTRRSSQLAHELRAAHEHRSAVPPLPAGVHLRWRVGRRGGPPAVAPSRVGLGGPRRVHPAARTEPRDRTHRSMGAPRGRTAVPGVAGAEPSRSHHVGERLGTTAAGSGLPR